MIDAHRGAFEYDWRTRFHLPLTVIGDSMTWGEALRLTRVIELDPSSVVAASIAKWDRPASRESLMLMEIWDELERTRAGRKAVKWTRPWEAPKTIGRTRLSIGQLRKILDNHRAGVTDDG